MSNTFRMLRENTMMAWVLLYLTGLFAGLIMLLYLFTVGGNPMKVTDSGHLYDMSGQPRDEFRSGDLVTVRREICSTQTQTLLFTPALRNSNGVLFPLPPGRSLYERGCRPSGYSFFVPPLPAGQYTYVNQITFQNNMIGRDEYATYPPLTMRILP